MSIVGCEFLAGSIDGDSTDATTDADVAIACSGPIVAADITALANELGDEDGELEKSDLADIEGFDSNQISEDCDDTLGGADTVSELLTGFGCALVVFTFVDDESPTTVDPSAGLLVGRDETTLATDYVCDTEAEDEDCLSATGGGTDNNGDGVVTAFIFVDTSTPGDVDDVIVSQEAVEQSEDVTTVGSANNVILTVVETTIQTHGSNANLQTCVGDAADTTTPGGLGIPGTAVDDSNAVSDPSSTLAYAQAFDQDDTELARVPVFYSIDPASATPSILDLGDGNALEGTTGNTHFTLDPGIEGAPLASYIVVCGGTSTGTADLDAMINIIAGGVLSSEDNSTVEITVVGAPASVALSLSASQIECNGTNSATITATVTDSAGNPVAAGVPVNFSVVALGTANPINTTTNAEGVATSVITPLSNASAGVTVIVTAGDDDVATPVQASTRVDCSIPLAPTPGAPVATPTRTGIGGPDTGNGGFLGGDSDSSGTSAWMLVAFAVAGITLVGGGLVARRAGK
jgi:hypothetical protein